MHLPNPIYDEVFERLLEDREPARLIIGTILGEEVEVVPHETLVRVELANSTLQGIDLAATVRTAGGEPLRVLVKVHLRRLVADAEATAAMELEDEVIGEWRRREEAIAAREEAIAEREETIAGQEQTIAGQEEAIAGQEETIRRQQAEIETLRRGIADADSA